MSREGGNRLAEFLSRTGARWSIRISQGSLNKLSVLFKQRARIPAPEWQLQPSDPKILMPAESARQSSSAVSTNLCSALQGLLASSCARLASARFSAGKSSTRDPRQNNASMPENLSSGAPRSAKESLSDIVTPAGISLYCEGVWFCAQVKIAAGYEHGPRQAALGGHILPVLPPPRSSVRGERAL